MLEKLPLADSVWRLLHFTMDDPWLDDLWVRHRGRCYERDLKFSTLAHLIAGASSNMAGRSGQQAFERRSKWRSAVSITSAYTSGEITGPASETSSAEGSLKVDDGTLPRQLPRRRRRRIAGH